MQINHILLKNFKCFRKTDIRFSRITLLTGENSSGKSSVLYGLLAPFQSNKFPFYLSPNGKYVNMGDFREISFNNLKENEIEFDISVTSEKSGDEKRYQTLWKIDSAGRMPELDGLKYKTALTDFEAVSEGKHGDYSVNYRFDGKIADSDKTCKTPDKFLYLIEDIKISDDDLNFIGPSDPNLKEPITRKQKQMKRSAVPEKGILIRFQNGKIRKQKQSEP